MANAITAEEYMALLRKAETMRDLLVEADKRIVWEHHGLGSDFTERVEAVIFDASRDAKQNISPSDV
jgi:hypothetical protein